MRVLVVGGGGREHALAWKIHQSPEVELLLCAPGNAGTASVARNVDVSASDVAGLVELAVAERVDLVVVGPEAPLVAGLADALAKHDIDVFGPVASGARLEGSKVFAKQLMQRYLIPTATFRAFDDYDEAAEYIDSIRHYPVVIKADGLAAGKGVVLPETREEALEEALSMLEAGRFGDAGRRILIEECLRGPELSMLALTDGKTIVELESSQDHKRALDGDEGPNTGGMGAFSPTPVADARLVERVTEDVLVRVVHGFARERIPYRGVLYAGLMATRGGPRVLEFNCRFGDPETQAVLMRLRSDVVPLLRATAQGTLSKIAPLEWDPRPAVCVVLASRGYPETSSKGDVITGLEEAAAMEDVQVFHAGTAVVDGDVVTSGGRVLGVTALGDDVADARRRAYAAVECIRFDGMQYRTDIASSAV